MEKLLLEEKSKDLNIYPIMKAKQLLSLGRSVKFRFIKFKSVNNILFLILQRCAPHSG